MRFVSLFAIYLTSLNAFSQLSTLPTKERFDAFNTSKLSIYNPCGLQPSEDGNVYGDGVAYILDALVQQYITTKDKGYLYRFVETSLCIMRNRHDLSSYGNTPRWSDLMYHDGYIIGSLSRFVYLVRVEEPQLLTTPVYQFSFIASNPFNIPFATFGQFTSWLGLRVNETLDWYLYGGYWDGNLGMLEFPGDPTAAHMNLQVGFARAFLFMGYSDPNFDYQQCSQTIASLFKSMVFFQDRCEVTSYNVPVLIPSSNNSYVWYTTGWKVPERDCFDGLLFVPRFNEPHYSGYIEFLEDISHGAVDLFYALDCYHFQPGTPFTQSDMIRFRNTFAKNIYDGNGAFFNSVWGLDNPIYNTNCAPCPHNFLAIASMNYMPFHAFDGADNTSTAPDVYDIVIQYYAANIDSFSTLPVGYDGLHNRGHAEVVAAQWERECVDLTLFNRNVVYNQDFWSKNILTIDPAAGPGASFADPIITTPEFTVESTVTSNIYAPQKVILKPGTKLKNGSHVRVFIQEDLCQPGGKRIADLSSVGETNVAPSPPSHILSPSLFHTNPVTDQITFNITLPQESVTGLSIINMLGKTVGEPLKPSTRPDGSLEITYDISTLPPGVYFCILQSGTHTVTTKLIKK